MFYDEKRKLEKAVVRGWIAAAVGGVASLAFLFPITFIGSVVAFGTGLGVCYRKGFGWPGFKLMMGALIGPVILLAIVLVKGSQ